MRHSVKISLTIVSAIILLAGAIVCVLRWKAWFGNQPEAEYAVPVYPNNIVFSYGESAINSRIVSWRADTMLQPSAVRLLSWSRRDTTEYAAEGSIVSSRSGKAAYYRVVMDSLSAGNYSYCCITGESSSEWYPLFVADRQAANRMQQFIVFGDIQDKGDGASETLFANAFSDKVVGGNNVAGMVFVGDIIERPTDKYWQVFFSAIGDMTARLPVIAATGNHEYLKGVRKKLDSRWIHVFGNPGNGPQRFLYTTYYTDFPQCRFIVLDTDALNVFSDFTVMQTWLEKVLKERKNVWKIVVMHHPVYSAGKNRSNALIRIAFRRALQSADLVFCGHDHNYMRRMEGGGKPVYILTNSSEKYYTPKDEIKADSHASNMRFFESVKIYPDSIRVDTWNAESDSVFDSALVVRMPKTNNIRTIEE